MSEKTLKFDNVEVNKKEFCASKQAIDLNLVDTDKIVISDKFKHSDNGSKYFIGYKEDNVVRPLGIVLPQLSGYIKYFDDGRKNVSFKVEDDNVKTFNKVQFFQTMKFQMKKIITLVLQQYLLILS